MLGQAARLANRALDQRAGLAGQPQRRRLALTGARGQRPIELALAPADRPRTVANPRRVRGHDGGGRARQRLGRVDGQADVGRIANVSLDHRRVDPRGPRDKAPLARRRAGDHHAADVVDDIGPQPPHELADRRLVRDALGQRDPAEPAQMQRVRDLAHQRLIAPPRALLDDHQPHEHGHRDRRTTTTTSGLIPRPLHRPEQRRVGQQPVQRRQIRRQLANLDRQPQIKQRLHLTTRQTKHPPSKSPDLQAESSPPGRTEPPTISGASN